MPDLQLVNKILAASLLASFTPACLAQQGPTYGFAPQIGVNNSLTYFSINNTAGAF